MLSSFENIINIICKSENYFWTSIYEIETMVNSCSVKTCFELKKMTWGHLTWNKPNSSLGGGSGRCRPARQSWVRRGKDSFCCSYCCSAARGAARWIGTFRGRKSETKIDDIFHRLNFSLNTTFLSKTNKCLPRILI